LSNASGTWKEGNGHQFAKEHTRHISQYGTTSTKHVNKVKYVGYPENNFRFHVEHELVGAACRGCTAV
jgi:hypothetical protein